MYEGLAADGADLAAARTSPRSASGPSGRCSSACASWCGSPKRPCPRPLQEAEQRAEHLLAGRQTHAQHSQVFAADRGRRPRRRGIGTASVCPHARRRVDRDRPALAVAAEDVADQEVAARVLMAVLRPSRDPPAGCAAPARASPGPARASVSCSTSSAGREPRLRTTLPSHSVTVHGWPIGSAPCATIVWMPKAAADADQHGAGLAHLTVEEDGRCRAASAAPRRGRRVPSRPACVRRSRQSATRRPW